jgi:putative molybdopterin biosynthesis protein
MHTIYLKQTSRSEALERFLSRVSLSRRAEQIPVRSGLGRVTTEPVFARRSIPGYLVAAMDGIAVKATDTYGASDQQLQELTRGENYLPVDTGDPIPDGFDAVIKIEDLQQLGAGKIGIMTPTAPWQHVRSVGEDVVAQEIIFPAYHRLRPVDLGVLLAGGISTINVLDKPRVVIIPTGDELADPQVELQRGEIPEFNSTVIAGYLDEWGTAVEVHPIVRDRPEDLSNKITAALAGADMVLINAGSSAGREDFTAAVIERLGQVLVRGIATKPGKPTILGQIQEKPVVGLPGYPVSAYLALEWFVRPLLYRYYGQAEPERPRVRALTGKRIISEPGVEEFVRVNIACINGQFFINPLPRGAGVTMSLARADGLLVIPASNIGYEKGDQVEVELFRPEPELRKTIVAVGSHDQALDLLGTYLKQIRPEISFSSSHVGSMGGITALADGQAHLAGIHLFDDVSGEYNIPFVKEYLKDQQVVLVNLAYRTQGWMTAPGNPYRIREVTDLTRDGITFINRQRGAGTRLLFDYLLKQAGISAGQIYGYQKEEYTELNVAAAVASGTADAGMGVLSAARAYDLDFIPIAEERYDLLLTDSFYQSESGRIFIEAITSTGFRNAVEALGGYSLRDAGKVMYHSDGIKVRDFNDAKID